SPGNFFAGLLARNHTRRRDIVTDLCSFTNSHLPWKFSQYKAGSGFRRLKQSVRLTQIIQCACSRTANRKRTQDADIVPVPVVFRQISKTLEWIKEDVFVPAVRD